MMFSILGNCDTESEYRDCIKSGLCISYFYICNIAELTPDGNNQILFGNLIRTDDFVVDFLFYKRNQTSYGPSLKSFDLTLKDFTLPEVAEKYHPIFVDPGRKSAFTAVSGLNAVSHPIIRCSTKEYYHLTGSTVFSAQQQSLKSQNGIEGIESSIPTAKTSNPERFLDYVQYLLNNINTSFNFYNSSTAKKNASNFIKGGKKRKKLWSIYL